MTSAIASKRLYRLHQSAWSAWLRRRQRARLRRRRALLPLRRLPAQRAQPGRRDAQRAPRCGDLARAERAAARPRRLPRATSSTRASWRARAGSTCAATAATTPTTCPNQWQGRFDALQVIGDKRGGAVHARHRRGIPTCSRACALWSACRSGSSTSCATRSTTSARSRSGTSCRSTRASTSTSPTATRPRDSASCARPDELLTVRHEDMLRDPRAVLSRPVRAARARDLPRLSRRLQRDRVRASRRSRAARSTGRRRRSARSRRARSCPFLDGYQFEIPDDRPPVLASGPAQRRTPGSDERRVTLCERRWRCSSRSGTEFASRRGARRASANPRSSALLAASGSIRRRLPPRPREHAGSARWRRRRCVAGARGRERA